jgi:hypothetical protein
MAKQDSDAICFQLCESYQESTHVIGFLKELLARRQTVCGPAPTKGFKKIIREALKRYDEKRYDEV